jgi:hypothetical protein
MPRLPALLAMACCIVAPCRAADTLLTLTPRSGAELRVVMERPPAPIGSVLLLAGGAGVLDIDARGHIQRLARNQLVRTRAVYARAGYIVFVPDIASDLRNTRDYRFSSAHAQDLALLVATARNAAAPVWVIATSRGAVSATNLFAKQALALPDGLVISSGTLMRYRRPAAADTGDPAAIRVPVLLLRHRDDACMFTPPADADRFKALLTGAPKVDIVTLSGGGPTHEDADPCGADHYHGFRGIDEQVVAATVTWMKANARRQGAP